MVDRTLRWLANASYRQQQLAVMLMLGAVFTLLGGFGAFGRFLVQLASEYYLLAGESATAPDAAALNRAVELRPDWARAHLSLAQAYYSDEWYDGAIREGEKAFELAQDKAEKATAIALVGFAHIALAHNNEAIDALKLAVELDPVNAKARVALDQLQQKQSGGS